MNIILMLIGVVIVYNILRITYRDNWSRNLSVDVTFSSNTATKGDTIKMVETVTMLRECHCLVLILNSA